MPGVWKRQAQWLTVGLTVTAIGLSACSSEDPDDRGTTSVPDVTTAVPEGDSPSPIDPVNGEPILIETHLTNISAGEVLPGSFIGDSPFCPGGRVRAEHGNPDVGLVLSTFPCRGGQLSIGFSPMQRSFIQSSSWKVVDGRGSYEGHAARAGWWRGSTKPPGKVGKPSPGRSVGSPAAPDSLTARSPDDRRTRPPARVPTVGRSVPAGGGRSSHGASTVWPAQASCSPESADGACCVGAGAARA